MKNRILAIVLAAMLTVSLTACSSGGATSSSTPAGSSSSAPAGTSEVIPATEPKALEAAIAEQPILLTSVGQSADVEMVKVMIEKNELKYTLSSLATEADLGDNKTLVLAVGGSSKGLGAAGINADQEIERVSNLIKAAKEKGMTVISLHIGGEARRGELSDKFIAPCISESDYVILVEEGNKDGLITKLAAEKDIPVSVVKGMGDVVVPLKAAFKE